MPSNRMFIPGTHSSPPGAVTARRVQQIVTTLALLVAFRAHTAAVSRGLRSYTNHGTSSRRQTTPCAQPQAVFHAEGRPVLPFEVGPLSGLDARFVEWLEEDSGGGTPVLVRRGRKDLVGLILGFDWW